jgi:hypothetical protein
MGKAATARANTAPPTPSQAEALQVLSEQVTHLVRRTEVLEQQKDEAVRRAETAEARLGQPSRSLPPVSRTTGIIDSGELEQDLGGQGDAVTMSEDPVTRNPYLVERKVEIDGAQVVDPKWVEQMHFNEERVTILVHEATDPRHPEPCISLWNSGVHQLIIRGEPQVVKRKFVEILARSRPVGYGNEEYVKEDGTRDVRWPKRIAFKYPFSVIKDDNPRGAAWLRKIVTEV